MDIDINKLENLGLMELREIAKELGIKSITKYRKQQLKEKIIEKMGEKEAENDKKTDTHIEGDSKMEEIKSLGEKNAIQQTPVKESLPVVKELSDPLKELIQTQGDVVAEGILDILPDGFGFLRVENFTQGPKDIYCLLYTSPSPRDRQKSRMPSSA